MSRRTRLLLLLVLSPILSASLFLFNSSRTNSFRDNPADRRATNFQGYDSFDKAQQHALLNTLELVNGSTTVVWISNQGTLPLSWRYSTNGPNQYTIPKSLPWDRILKIDLIGPGDYTLLVSYRLSGGVEVLVTNQVHVGLIPATATWSPALGFASASNWIQSVSLAYGQGFVSTNGPAGPYRAFPASGTNWLISQTNNLHLYVVSGYGNTSTTNNVVLDVKDGVLFPIPSPFFTNAPFSITVQTPLSNGFLSTNGAAGPWASFANPSTNLSIAATTTFHGYGQSGSYQSPTNIWTITFDNSAPTLTSSLAMNLLTNLPVTLTLGVNENHGYWSTNGASGPWLSFSSNGTNLTFSTTCTLHAFARDLAGNCSATNQWTYQIDSVAPTLTRTYAGNLATNQPVTQSLSVNENNGWWSTNGATGPWQLLTTTTPTNLTFAQNATLYTWSQDAAGNVTATNAWTYTLDTTTPAVNNPFPSSLTTNAPWTLSLGVTENFGYVSTTALSGPYGAFPNTGTNLVLSGNVTVHSFARDLAGNTSATNSVAYNVTNARAPYTGEYTTLVVSPNNSTNIYGWRNETTFISNGADSSHLSSFRVGDSAWRSVNINGDGSIYFTIWGLTGRTNSNTILVPSSVYNLNSAIRQQYPPGTYIILENDTGFGLKP